MGDLEDSADSRQNGVQLRDDKLSADTAIVMQLIDDEQALSSPHEIAAFLHELPHMDPTMVGRVLGEPDPLSLSVLQVYANGFAFAGFSIDVALRVFLGRFVLPGEAQKIDRILQAFAHAFFCANPRDPTCVSEDAVYTLAFALVLLNTDAHNPHLAKRFKMTRDDFIRNHRRIVVHGAARVPPTYLAQCYDSFAAYPLSLIASKPAQMLPDVEVELVFSAGPLGLAIETSIDGRTCLVKQYALPDPLLRQHQSHHHQNQQAAAIVHWHDETRASTKVAGPQLAGWVIVAVGSDCTRQIGYPITRFLLRTASRPLCVRFCEPSVFFASLA